MTGTRGVGVLLSQLLGLTLGIDTLMSQSEK